MVSLFCLHPNPLRHYFIPQSLVSFLSQNRKRGKIPVKMQRNPILHGICSLELKVTAVAASPGIDLLVEKQNRKRKRRDATIQPTLPGDNRYSVSCVRLDYDGKTPGSVDLGIRNDLFFSSYTAFTFTQCSVSNWKKERVLCFVTKKRRRT